VITAAIYREFGFPVVRHRFASHSDPWRALHWLYLADKHQWFIIALVLMKAGRKIRNPVTVSIFYGDFRNKHIGIFKVILVRRVFFLRQDRKCTPFIFIKQAAKNKRTVKTRPAQPIHVCVFVDMGKVSAVTNNSGVVNVFSHGCGE
jgi:hypothetical protein